MNFFPQRKNYKDIEFKIDNVKFIIREFTDGRKFKYYIYNLPKHYPKINSITDHTFFEHIDHAKNFIRTVYKEKKIPSFILDEYSNIVFRVYIKMGENKREGIPKKYYIFNNIRKYTYRLDFLDDVKKRAQEIEQDRRLSKKIPSEMPEGKIPEEIPEVPKEAKRDKTDLLLLGTIGIIVYLYLTKEGK